MKRCLSILLFLFVFIPFAASGCAKRHEFNWALRDQVKKTWTDYSRRSLAGKRFKEEFGSRAYRLISKQAIDLSAMDEFFASLQQQLEADGYVRDLEIWDSGVFPGNWYVTSSNGRFLESLYELPADYIEKEDTSRSFTFMRIHTYYRPQYDDGIVLLSAGNLRRQDFLAGLADHERIKRFPAYLTIYLVTNYRKHHDLMLNGPDNHSVEKENQ